jgi:hypothetical protein
MLWIKRNLVLVIGMVVSLAMLGGAGYYLYDNLEENFTQNDELEKIKADLQQLDGQVFPSDANIAMVKSNTAQVLAFMQGGERVFGSDPVRAVSEGQIKVGLINLVDALRRDATNAGVEVPSKYEFTYGEVKAMPRVPVYALESLTNQFKEVRSLCGILFNAKVRALESLQRVPSFPDELRSADLLTDRAPQTNTLSTNIAVVITPYRLVFRGFSSHLTEVLNGLATAKEFYAVRQLDVEPSGGLDTPGMGMPGNTMPMLGFPAMGAPGLPTPGLPTPGVPAAMGAPPNPGVGMPPGVARPPPPKGAGGVNLPLASKSSLTKILDEKPLRITLLLDVVKVRKSVPTTPPPPTK